MLVWVSTTINSYTTIIRKLESLLILEWILVVNMAWIHNKDSKQGLFCSLTLVSVCVCACKFVCVIVALRQQTTTSHSWTGSVSKWPVFCLTRKWSVEGVNDKELCLYSWKPVQVTSNCIIQTRMWNAISAGVVVVQNKHWHQKQPGFCYMCCLLFDISTNIMLQIMKIYHCYPSTVCKLDKRIMR